MSYKEINAMRKEGNLSQALAMAESEFALQPDKHSAVALFWCLNSLRKETDSIDQSNAIIDRMTDLWERHAPDTAVLQKTIEVARASLSPDAISERKAWRVFKAAKEAQSLDEQSRLMFEYLKMDNPRPSKLHSLVLDEAIRIAKDNLDQFDLYGFTTQWSLDTLRAEDWEKPLDKDGTPTPSLIEKLLSAVAKQLMRSRQAPTPTLRMLLDHAIEQYKQNKHLLRYKAQFMALSGEKDNAIAMYKALLLQQSDTFYLWEELADLVDDPDLRTGMLCAAATCQVKEEFLPNVRMKLANEFIDLELYDEAKTELEIIADTYDRNDWPLPPGIKDLDANIPYDAEPVDCKPIYEQFKAQAIQFLYSEAETAILVKLKDVKEQLRGKTNVTWQMRGENGMVWVNPRKFRLDMRTPKGAVFLARMADGEVVSIEPTQLPYDQKWIRRVEGELSIKNGANGKRFGFVDSVFVTGTMLAGHSNGEYVSVLAVLNPDGRWGAILIY